MKNLSGHYTTRVANFLGGILFISLGTSFIPPETDILTKGNDTVAYNEALHELEMHILKDNVLNTNIEEQLKIFDKFSVRRSLNGNGMVNATSRELDAKPKENVKMSAPIDREKGWYFMFDK